MVNLTAKGNFWYKKTSRIIIIRPDATEYRINDNSGSGVMVIKTSIFVDI